MLFVTLTFEPMTLKMSSCCVNLLSNYDTFHYKYTDYKILSLTYEVLTTTQPSYLHV